MKTLELKFNLEGIVLSPEDKGKISQEITVIIIKNLIVNYGIQSQNRGLNEDERRKFYKICDLLDKAVKDKVDSVEFEDDWMGFLRQAKRSTNMIPNELVRKVEELIDAVKDR